MNTLPVEIQEHYYSLHEPGAAANAAAVIDGFVNEFAEEQADRELWLLFSGALTSSHLPFVKLAEERECMLHFYEYVKAVMHATYVLNHEAAKRKRFTKDLD